MLSEIVRKEFLNDPIISGANLTVYLGGLAVGHDAEDSWQSVFLDGIKDHPLQIAILKTFRDEVLAETFIYPTEVENGRLISIKGNGLNGTSTINDGTLHDHSLLADFSGTRLHDGPVKLVKPERMSLTMVEVDGGTAYTAKIADPGYGGDPNYYLLKPGQTDTANVDRFHLGTWMGIDQSFDNGSEVTFSMTGEQSQYYHRLIMEPEIVFKIIIGNICYSDQCKGEIDFPYYYHDEHNGRCGIVDMPRFALGCDNKLSAEGVAETSFFNGRVACNKMMISNMAGTNSLFDLAE